MSVTAVNHFQQAVLEFVAHGTGHGVVEATAGSGKTTTLVKVAESLQAGLAANGQRACFLAFNRSTADELRQRLPGSVMATTIHALGRRVLLESLAHATSPGVSPGDGSVGRPGDLLAPSPHKYRDLAFMLLEEGVAALPDLDLPEAAAYLARLADLSRLELIDTADAVAVRGLADRYRLRSPVAAGTPSLHALLPDLLARGAAGGQIGDATVAFDYTDMVYLPVHLRLRPPSFAFVCVDEAQDLSRLNLEFVMRLIEVGARALFVGDPQQAIYAFAGADARSLARIAQRTGATRLPLSVSFRCPARHVALARRFSPHMQAAPGAATGTLAVMPVSALPGTVRPGDLVMTRTNAPLVALSLALAERRVPSKVLGDELAQETSDLAARLFPSGHIHEGLAVVDAAAAHEAMHLERTLLTSEELPRELDRSADRHQALRLALIALERYWRPRRPPGATGSSPGRWKQRWLPGRPSPSLDDLTAVLAELLGAGVNSSQTPVILSTIHKAKGREADRVFLCRPDQLATAGGDPDEDLAEGNVLFVALTRARRELILVESEPGAVEARADQTGPVGSLQRSWNDVLRLAVIMARSPENGANQRLRPGGRLIIRHGATRRVQEPGGQTGGSRRGGGRR